MNTSKSILAAVALTLAASGTAFAGGGEATYTLPQAATSQTTRAAVLADLQQARATGTLRNSEADAQRNDSFVASRSRADVRSETLAAIASGELQLLNREGNNDFAAVRQAPAASMMAAK